MILINSVGRLRRPAQAFAYTRGRVSIFSETLSGKRYYYALKDQAASKKYLGQDWYFVSGHS